MEYYLTRAMEVCRLGSEDLIKLHTHEKNLGRCLLPSEIQEALGLCSLKEHYKIPEHDASQSAHNQRLKGEFRKNNLIPKHQDFIITEVDDIHGFDSKAVILADDLRIDLAFRNTKGMKRKLSEEMDGE